ncbi:putative TetR-family transcriptional regulator [Longimycelium tulufanense]|uniref:Putative TetR-family transcriptional regulator n=1 Tax=Longimycelium tulufanense TaxID=907463 RepID=A0A8J3CKL6_9PSEU|nr:TetR/AcrR family transcriptional regulator [Longimycelium tulufanense]GGM83145.1 putative TetR-family transcriptional regulator [Longimycelium tulufanense]
MSPGVGSAKGSRTQEERSAATRQLLLDATVDCLVRYGYAGTTTTRIAELAGVTRGALVHHFPSRADLVSAAVRHLASKRAEVAFARLEALRGSADPIPAALDMLWEVHQGSVFLATAELWVAARADATLAEQVDRFEPMVTGTLMEFSRALFPVLAGHPEFRHWLYTSMDVIRGILVSDPAGHEPDRLARRWQRARRHLLLLAEVLFDRVGPASATR